MGRGAGEQEISGDEDDEEENEEKKKKRGKTELIRKEWDDTTSGSHNDNNDNVSETPEEDGEDGEDTEEQEMQMKERNITDKNRQMMKRNQWK